MLKYMHCSDCSEICLLRRNLDSPVLLNSLTGCYVYGCGVVEYRFDYNLTQDFEGGVCSCQEEEVEG